MNEIAFKMEQTIIVVDSTGNLQFRRQWGYTDEMFNRWNCIVLCLAVAIGCGAPPERSEDTQTESSALSRLSFEQRMEIRARLTTIRTEAKEQAAKKHDRYASRDEAIAYEALVEILEDDARTGIMDEHGLSTDDLTYIINEYLDSQGVNLREE